MDRLPQVPGSLGSSSMMAAISIASSMASVAPMTRAAMRPSLSRMTVLGSDDGGTPGIVREDVALGVHDAGIGHIELVHERTSSRVVVRHVEAHDRDVGGVDARRQRDERRGLLRHGSHQEAHEFTTTTRPRRSARSTGPRQEWRPR